MITLQAQMAAQQPLWKAVRDGEFEVRLVTRVRGQSMGEGNVEVQVLYNEVGLQTKVPNPYAHEKSTSIPVRLFCVFGH